MYLFGSYKWKALLETQQQQLDLLTALLAQRGPHPVASKELTMKHATTRWLAALILLFGYDSVAHAESPFERGDYLVNTVMAAKAMAI